MRYLLLVAGLFTAGAATAQQPPAAPEAPEIQQLPLSTTAERVYDYANLAALGAYIESQLPAPTAMPAKPVQAVARTASVMQASPAPDAPTAVAPAIAAALPTPVSPSVGTAVRGVHRCSEVAVVWSRRHCLTRVRPSFLAVRLQPDLGE